MATLAEAGYGSDEARNMTSQHMVYHGDNVHSGVMRSKHKHNILYLHTSMHRFDSLQSL